MKIPDKMKALVAYAPNDYRLETVDVPLAGPGEIIIKVEGSGICSGDVKNIHGNKRVWGDENNPPYIQAPCIVGHEFVGRIVELGKDVDENLKLGDLVVSEQIVPCNDCRFCKNGNYHMCMIHDIYGYRDYVNGGMAEYMRFPARSITHKLPDDMPIEQAVLIEPYACAKHATDRGSIHKGDVVVVSGAGTIGLAILNFAKQKEPKLLISLDVDEDRLNLSKDFGADISINPAKEDVVKVIMDLTEGYGCDVYIEASGHPTSVLQGIDMIRKMGTFVELGVSQEATSLDFSIIGDVKEIDLLGAHLGPNCYTDVIQGIVDGSIRTEGVVARSYSLDDWKEAFELAGKGGMVLKVIIKP